MAGYSLHLASSQNEFNGSNLADGLLMKTDLQYHITGLVVNYGISNTTVLDTIVYH